MLERIYIHNFRCFENFEFSPASATSGLLIGRNGSGKSNLRAALKVFQSIGRGSNRVGDLLRATDFAFGRSDAPIRLEVEVKLDQKRFHYKLAFELPDRFRELRVLEEELKMDGVDLYSRTHGVVTLNRPGVGRDHPQFNVDWHLVALPIIQDPSAASHMGRFREWLRKMVILAPVPSLMSGDAVGDEAGIKESASNFAEWMSELLDQYPSAYAAIHEHVKTLMPDLSDLRFEKTGRESKSLLVRFQKESLKHEQPFETLSDGEKCFLVCATLLASSKYEESLLTVWDEPDNFLSISEVGQFVLRLRREFQESRGQIFMTSHNPEAIRRFSDETTWVIGRRSHLDPAILRPLSELPVTGDIVEAWVDGEIEPWL